jgi:16S rRNA (guanine1516-N2)-methyltransferase
MQILQTLLGKDDDTQELLNIALKVANKRVVVKRPKGADNLSNIKPTYQVSSKKTRYDIYIIQK